MAKDKLCRIAITCKANELVDKLAELNPQYPKYMLVSEIIENAYTEKLMIKGGK
jgi:hypothetical protein